MSVLHSSELEVGLQQSLSDSDARDVYDVPAKSGVIITTAASCASAVTAKSRVNPAQEPCASLGSHVSCQFCVVPRWDRVRSEACRIRLSWMSPPCLRSQVSSVRARVGASCQFCVVPRWGQVRSEACRIQEMAALIPWRCARVSLQATMKIFLTRVIRQVQFLLQCALLRVMHVPMLPSPSVSPACVTRNQWG